MVSRFRELELEALADGVDLAPLAERLREAGAAADPEGRARARVACDCAVRHRGRANGSNPTMADALSASLADNVGRLIHRPAGSSRACGGRAPGARCPSAPAERLADPAGRCRPRLAGADRAAAANDRERARPGPRHGRADRSSEGRSHECRQSLEAASRPARAAPSRSQRPPPSLPGRGGVPQPARFARGSGGLSAGWTDRRAVRGRCAADPRCRRLASSQAPGRRRRRSDVGRRSPPGADRGEARPLRRRAGQPGVAGSPGRCRGDGRNESRGRPGPLGALQDSIVAASVIRETLSGPRVSPRYAFEAGRLVERQRARGAAARAEFADVWADLRRKRWWKWTE